MKKVSSVFFVAVLSLALLSTANAAEPGGNCEVDLLQNVQKNADWKDQYFLQGDDGFVWQRAILTNSSDILTLPEGGTVDLNGTADPNAELQMFLFAPPVDSSDPWAVPGEGVCLSAGSSDASGLYSLEVGAPMLWNILNDKVIFDVYFKTADTWEEWQAENPTDQNFNIGTHSIPKVMKVAAAASQSAEVPSSGSEIPDFQMPDIDDQNGETGGDTTNPSTQQPQDDSPASGAAPKVCAPIDGETDIFGNDMLLAHILDPSKISNKNLIGSQFAAVMNMPVHIARRPGDHTFYAKAEGKDYDRKILQSFSAKALMMESLKRKLAGNENYGGSQSGISLPLTAQSIEQAYLSSTPEGATSSYSKTTQDTAVEIRNLMVKGEFMPGGQLAGSFSPDRMDDIMLNANQAKEFLPRSTEENWANDFITLVNFWSGSAQINTCLMENNRRLHSNFINKGINKEVNDFVYVQGMSPRIIVHSDQAIELKPQFEKTAIVYADRLFDFNEGWQFAADEVKRIAYRYTFTKAFTRERIAKVCLNPYDVEGFAESLMNQLGLKESEQQVVIDEFAEHVDQYDDWYTLRLAEPADIAERFKWQANGEDLNISQLFFETEVGGCEADDYLLPSSFTIDPERDGFEVGILE
jgi:hypothetical protein